MLETLRLRPPAYIVGRCAAEADDLAGYHVQPGKQSAVELQACLPQGEYRLLHEQWIHARC